MTGWGLLFQFGVAGVGALAFLSLLADDLDRAHTALDVRKDEERRRLLKEREEREEREAAMRASGAARKGAPLAGGEFFNASVVGEASDAASSGGESSVGG